MSKKIIISIFIIMTILQSINPIKVNAFEETHEIISVPAKIERQKAGDTVSETTGLDTMTGIILEPTVEFFTVIIDSIMGVLTSFMTQDYFGPVMVSYNKLPTELKETTEGEEIPTITLTEEEMSAYKRAGGLLSINFPNFTYSAEEIFAGKVGLLDINFFDSNEGKDENWIKIKNIISSWYKFLRMVAIIGLLSVLIYTGIKIILSSNTKDKAKYKEMIINWFIAVFLLFSMHYIMAFILSVIEQIMGLLHDISGTIKVVAGDKVFKTNLIGFARFQMQQMHFSAKVGYLIIYTALVVYTFKFTFIYLKRVLKMAFLTLIAPIVALTYPIDKINDGRAQGFDMWLKEYVFNALLQPLHYILYYILVSSAVTLAARNLIYGVAALMFISQAEKLLKRIFGFGKDRGGTVGGIAGAYATGAIASKLMNFARNPLHPFGGGKGSGKTGGNKLGSGNYDVNYEEPTGILEDINREEDLLNLNLRGITDSRNLEGQNLNPTIPDIDNYFSRYRAGLSGYSDEELGGLHFEDDPMSIEDMLQQLSQYNGESFANAPQEIQQLRDLLQHRVLNNESGFTINGIPTQYIDGDLRNMSDLLNDIITFNQHANDTSLSQEEREDYARRAQQSLKILKRRMAENQYIQRHGGAQALNQQEQERIDRLKSEEQPEEQRTDNRDNDRQRQLPKHIKGLKHVAKTIVKPVWDVEKSGKYNAKRLTGNILRGVTGVGVGITATAVQAGISITDGKYSPVEGIAAFSAGVAGVAKIGKGTKSIGQTYREGASEGENGQAVKEYGQQWFNRDDVISEYNREFPGQGKEMRRRAVNNYISRGITDSKEQIQAMRFANQLKSERGLDEEEADKIAIATLQYKQTLSRNGSYTIIFDKKKREKYLDKEADTYTVAASKDSIKKLHNDLIENILDFDRANR